MAYLVGLVVVAVAVIPIASFASSVMLQQPVHYDSYICHLAVVFAFYYVPLEIVSMLDVGVVFLALVVEEDVPMALFLSEEHQVCWLEIYPNHYCHQ